MLFENYNPTEVEPAVIKYLDQNKILHKLKHKNEKGPKWGFLQGPPYTSGKVHLGTAWNTALKDIALRYKRSQGFNVWDRNGYDVHGLPTEHKVVEKYGLKFKEDIEEFGVGKFVSECKKFCLEMGEQMTKDFLRMGSTLDYTDSYMALKNDYIEGEWWLVKQAWDKKRLYVGDKSMTWCGNCETSLAKHECEYKLVNDDSIFLKFKVSGKENEYLIIWTTTPWTIPFNLAIMVNPELDYVKADVEGETWIVGKGLVGPLVQSVAGKKLKILEEFKGEKLAGLKYDHPWFDDIKQFAEITKEQSASKNNKLHTVILSEQYVDFTAGSGLVHCAPGCGPEDQEVGAENKLPSFNNLNERGEFPVEIGKRFAGRVAKVDDKKFIKDMEKDGFLIASTKVEHDYPTCWRCHKPVIFKTTKQWFFKIEDIKDKMVKENQKVKWVPETQAFDSWTAHLRDNSITRQRYWGTAVPIWKCQNTECENINVIGSIKELKEKAGKIPEDLHRPWIDEVVWNCEKCGTKMRRIPDILDVWIDAGTCSWNCFYYPQKEEHMKDFFPADLILEATEQVRLWFSMLSICSQLSMDKNCYKNVYMHGMLRGIDGEKMSKSLGNIISPDEMIQKHGADVLRYYMCQTNAGQDIKFSWDNAALKQRYLQIFWNIHKLLINLAKENDVNPFVLKESSLSKSFSVEEKYILSKLNSTIKKVTELFDAYHFDETIGPIEELYLELSRTYVQMIRDKSVMGNDKEKKVCIYTISKVLFESIKMFNIICPFITEAIYLNFKEAFDLKEESICHYPFPKVEKKMINEELEKDLVIAQDIITSTLGAREKAQLGLRWPIKEITIETEDAAVIKAVHNLHEVIKRQTNAKELSVMKQIIGVKLEVIGNPAKIGPVYGKLSGRIMAKLSEENPERILKHLESKGKYTFKLDDQDIDITKEMLEVKRSAPDNHQFTEGSYAVVYVNILRNEDLDAEGYSRELTRHIQNLRKNAGLERKDTIKLELNCSKELKVMFQKFEKEIREKVGAELVTFNENEGEEVKIKKEKIRISFKKC
ncbi:MAG: isoleucine--tRNA ligase [Candidatus Woesearchaeota archaeon]